MKNIFKILFGMVALYSCLYVLLGTITLVEIIFNLR